MSQKRNDLLEVAEQLFYEYGFNGVGLKQIIQEANVATMTLYNHFDSKEKLVEAVLKQREARYWKYLDEYTKTKQAQPLTCIVKAHCKWLKDNSYKGDMFLRAIEDYAESNQDIVAIARGHKQRLLDYLEHLTEKQGLEDQEALAIQYALLLEGTTSMTALVGVDKATEHALRIAKMYIREAAYK
ncbi:TetR/AcrR family transcriptional regulator [Staphylococcus simulans]|uniref:TetR/AcrR family transcriptional regulator n=1 Tax=Staphylococcus simulans TaxID=1286 RepID=UPI000E67EAB7|nr:TetR/AcrR family transcriptional regulator [Staphylococcus simulans]RIN75175.1 TetR/AcrR family transcriptional regulator [Staphylococcus simulans]